jgi:hypothetical protein
MITRLANQIARTAAAASIDSLAALTGDGLNPATVWPAPGDLLIITICFSSEVPT